MSVGTSSPMSRGICLRQISKWGSVGVDEKPPHEKRSEPRPTKHHAKGAQKGVSKSPGPPSQVQGSYQKPGPPGSGVATAECKEQKEWQNKSGKQGAAKGKQKESERSAIGSPSGPEVRRKSRATK